ncbi:uncharacterized protein K444DRAFT_535285 [Hyaloscypha bicolor E]|uniref:Tat pathway signal sequence n=1 Tax=Hyaloscypha bicolor E TaxID=1095630 RepID=A0A2J6T2D6_9HELO|nr:uncharacterized protein K444DRAFT_535285 [Hyaloscypha bicolor E]PMD57179.1 hypothetical protein K444DRAFT_535285 [Hyaloscypha bicolor E]
MKDINAGYEKVPPDELSTTVAEDGAGFDLFELKQQNLRTEQIHRSKCLLIANSILFCTSAFLLATTYIRGTPNTAQFVSKFSSYSPARKAVQYVSGTFNATQGKDSGYIGTSNETEEMWNWVTVDMGDQMVTPEELKLVNKPETSVKIKNPKTGKEGYRIGLEVFHQLHCLNLVRKSTYRDHYEGKGDFAEEDEVKIRNHLDHCLEMLRMNIMCQVDIGVITFHELPDKPGDPWPDFSTLHVCRDFDAVRKWAIDNTVANDDIF